ncbi:MAG: isochorismatase family protein [Clostridia bacterium]|nr:isochorismatase family protein [Clostridia bacterium]
MFFTPQYEKTVREVTVSIRTYITDPETTVIVNMDTVNGYFKKGKMASSRLNAIIPQLVRVNEYYLDSPKLFFTDTHTPQSEEFETYPAHCVDKYEQEVISELESFAEVGEIIPKNSTNGFFCKQYLAWLAKHKEIENIIIVGACTDTSVLQFALAQRAYWNENNNNNRIIVIENAVQTYHDDIHNGDLMHNFALFNMYMNGIKLANL